MAERAGEARDGERAVLAGVIAVAFLTRALALVLLRPEFVGWFNHSYYYWVQAKGIVTGGHMPYADMPLIFYLYAAAATVLHGFGMDWQPAIVVSSRMIMSLAPALVPYPVYLMVRRIGGMESLSRRRWVLVALSGFLPLTFAHAPEILQKNTLGLLFLCGLMAAALEAVHGRSKGAMAAAGLLFVLIALTHLGTLAVALLFGLSLLAAGAAMASRRQILVLATAVAASSALGIGAVWIFHPTGLTRALRYARSSLPHSLLGGALEPGPPGTRLAYLAGMLVPLALVLLAAGVWRRHRQSLAPADQIFWLGSVIFCYALVLPCYDVELIPRLLLFAPLPALVVLAYMVRWNGGKWPMRILLSAASAGVVLMTAGEIVNLVMRYPDKGEIRQELADLRVDCRLGEGDLVLTTYAVNPVCNWFLGTKSGLITAFNREDAKAHARVFVLNPLEESPAAGPAEAAPGGPVTFTTPEERYRAMRQRIPVPENLPPMVKTGHLEFYRLEVLPENWLFDGDGRWIGYRAPGSAPEN